VPGTARGRRVLKTAEYRRNVTERRTKPQRVVDRVISGVDSEAEKPPFDAFLKSWVPVITGVTENPQFPEQFLQTTARHGNLLDTVSIDEVHQNLPNAKTAPGPDGFGARSWRKIPVLIQVGLFNLFVAAGGLPKGILASRTIFVPKKGNPAEAENYRPISIASVIARHFNRILAVRLERLSAVDVRQRAFRGTDGVAENLFLLSSLLRDARSRCRGLCLAALDLSKAFDSVSHDAIYCAMRRVGLSASFISYVEQMYRNSGTFIQVGQQSSRALVVQKGRSSISTFV
jgi:hypothetical protein